MGNVFDIYVADRAGGPMRAVVEVLAIAEQGLENDRYCLRVGSFSRWPDSGRAVTLIAREAIDAVRAEFGIDLSAGRHRRNLVTDQVDLVSLKGKKFRIGKAIFRGSRVASPCKYLERLTEPRVFDALRGRGGLRADVLESGIIRVGDGVEI